MNREEFEAEFNSYKQSEKAVVANYFNMCNIYPGFEAAYEAWSSKSGGYYTIGEFFEFLDSYEASVLAQNYSGQAILN